MQFKLTHTKNSKRYILPCVLKTKVAQVGWFCVSFSYYYTRILKHCLYFENSVFWICLHDKYFNRFFFSSLKSSRRKKLDSMDIDRRKKPVTVSGPYIVYMLREADIIDDWTMIKKSLQQQRTKKQDGRNWQVVK